MSAAPRLGATANPTADLSPDTIRDTIAGMVARIVGCNAPDADAANAVTASFPYGTSYDWLYAVQYSGADMTAPLDVGGAKA